MRLTSSEIVCCPSATPPERTQKYMNIAGATPKFTKSASESSSAPSFELHFRRRATRPSIASHTHAMSSARNPLPQSLASTGCPARLFA